MYAQTRLLRCNHCRKNWDPVQLHEGEQLKKKTTMKKRFGLMSLLLLILSSQSIFVCVYCLPCTFPRNAVSQGISGEELSHFDFMHLIKEFLIKK